MKAKTEFEEKLDEYRRLHCAKEEPPAASDLEKALFKCQRDLVEISKKVDDISAQVQKMEGKQ